MTNVLHMLRPFVPFVAVLFPAVLVYKYGEDALPLMLGLAGFASAFLLQKSKWMGVFFYGTMAAFLFSVEIDLPGGAALSLPGEPLLLLLAAAALIISVFKNSDFNYLLRQPVFWAIALLAFSWIFSAAFSTNFQISAKYVFINMVFVLGGFLGTFLLLQQRKISWQLLMKILAAPLVIFSGLAVFNMLPFGFNPGAAAMIGQPFFKDHTIFSATFSMLIPAFLLWHSFTKSSQKFWRWLMPLVGAVLLFAMVISSSRAAWLSLILAAFLFLFVKLGGQLKHLILVAILFAVGVAFNFQNISQQILVSQYKSTDAAGNFTDQVLSVTNISSDVSNLERLNRWNSAVRMGLAKPWVGFGPGMYQFTYFPYQADADKTYISVNNPFTTQQGRGGSAHSEYLLLLAENGFLGLFAWLFLQIALLFSFFKTLKNKESSRRKNLTLAIYLGIFTFSIHSLFNNYLNTVQFGFLWWMLVGAFCYFSMITKSNADAADH